MENPSKILFTILIIFTIIGTSCNKDEEPAPIEGTTITLTGFESGTYELDATFLYSPGLGVSPTWLNINIENKDTPNFELIISLNELGESEGFDVGTYSFFDDPENFIFNVKLGMPGKNFEIFEPEISGTNEVEFTTFTNDNIRGRFEANIVSSDFAGGYDRINVSGTFDAVPLR